MASSGSYDPVPLVLTLLLFFLLMLGLGLLFLQYRATRRDLEFCQAFRTLHLQTQQIYNNSSN